MATGRNGNGIGRVALIASIGASGLLLLGAIGGFFYVAFQTRSNSDLLEVNSNKIQELQGLVSDTRGRLSGQEMALNEIETQFCGEDIVRNLMHANDMRVQSMLWAKTFPGSILPTDNSYYPNICNRKPQR